MELSNQPGDVRCPVVGCRRLGDRWVVLHEHWRIALCEPHAAEVEADSEAWRLVGGRADGVLRIGRAGSDRPDRIGLSQDMREEADGRNADVG